MSYDRRDRQVRTAARDVPPVRTPHGLSERPDGALEYDRPRENAVDCRETATGATS